MPYSQAIAIAAMWISIPAIIVVYHKTAEKEEFSVFGVMSLVAIAAIVTVVLG